MATRKRQPAEGEQHEPRRRRLASGDRTIKAPEFNTCKYLFEAVSPEFDPNRVLLRRVFFVNEDKTRYVSVGFYPTQNYQPHVEFGGPSIKPLILEDQHVTTLAECLPKICASMCDDEQFACSDGIFRLTTTGSYKKARLYKDKHYITLTFQDLRYLNNMFHVVHNQLNSYIEALPDLMTYVLSALSSATYVEPASTASRLILYPQLFEELKTIL